MHVRRFRNCTTTNNKQADVDFRNTHQRPENGREFDLNDPNSLKNEQPIPARAPGEDADSRLGVSACQYFEGEDMLNQQRDALQKQQQREWHKTAMAENAANKAAAAQAKVDKDNFENAQIRETRRQMDILEAQKKADYMQARAENKAMMDAQAAKNQADKHNTARQDCSEVVNTLNSEMMQEPLQSGCTVDGRIMDTHKFKGFHPELNNQYLMDREAQRAEEAQRKRDQYNEDVTAHRIETNQARQAELAARQAARDRRSRQQNVNVQNDTYRTMQQIHVLKHNAIAPDFFSQFGTTSR